MKKSIKLLNHENKSESEWVTKGWVDCKNCGKYLNDDQTLKTKSK